MLLPAHFERDMANFLDRQQHSADGSHLGEYWAKFDELVTAGVRHVPQIPVSLAVEPELRCRPKQAR